MRGFIKNISPFNNKDDMPSALLITKKLLALFLCYLAGIFLAEGLVIGGLFLCGRNFLKGEMFSDNVMLLIKLYGMIILIAVCILYWKLVVKRKLNEMGITKKISGWFMGAGMGVFREFQYNNAAHARRIHRSGSSRGASFPRTGFLLAEG